MALLSDLQAAIQKFKDAAPGIVQTVCEPPINMTRDWENLDLWKPYQRRPGVYAFLDDKLEVFRSATQLILGAFVYTPTLGVGGQQRKLIKIGVGTIQHTSCSQWLPIYQRRRSWKDG